MKADSGRWIEVTTSRYPHEREGLEHVREQLPDAAPYVAWLRGTGGFTPHLHPQLR